MPHFCKFTAQKFGMSASLYYVANVEQWLNASAGSHVIHFHRLGLLGAEDICSQIIRIIKILR